jgi:Tfp pilus assembly protein PilF
MKKSISVFLILIVVLLVSSHCTGEKKMQITTSSETAKALYDKAVKALENFYLVQFRSLMSEALKADPDFFMADYQLANYFLYMGTKKRFIEYADKAVNCKAALSKGELLLKDALLKLLKNQDADVTNIGRELVKMYPADAYAYWPLARYQSIIKDTEGQIATLKTAMEVTDNKGPIYNNLGYIYLNQGKYEDALTAFDNYIEVAPNLPNAYDSKGDYFMQVKDYRNAYESYMKAHELDSTFSFKKALKAKAIADSLENK